MAKITENLIRNLDFIWKANKTNATRFCEDCEKSGIRLTRSTISRVMSGANTGLETISDIVQGIHSCYPHFAWVTASDLISENFNLDVAYVNNEKFREFICKLVVDLDELQWIELKKETSIIADFATLVGKDFGINTDSQRANAFKIAI